MATQLSKWWWLYTCLTSVALHLGRAEIPRTMSHFMWWSLIFSWPPYKTCFISPFWRPEFWVGSYVFEKFLDPCRNLASLRLLKLDICNIFITGCKKCKTMDFGSFQWCSIRFKFSQIPFSGTYVYFIWNVWVIK